MNFPSRPKIRAGFRRHQSVCGPAEVETLENRLLLATTPNLLTPTGTVTEPAPRFTWEAVDNAESYDLWITSLESYETILVERGITATEFTPAEGDLSLGKIRTWVRANLAGGGVSDWSPASEAVMKAAPTLTGPVGQGARLLTSDNTPEITWTSSTLASRFQIWVTDLTAKAAAETAAAGQPVDVSVHSQQYNVANLTPELDANGDPVLDANGDPVLQEIRSFVIPEDPTNPDSAARELPLGRYRIWILAVDQSGGVTNWSAPRTFDVGPKPVDLAPDAPAFGESPPLMWDAVDRATHYEVFVAQTGGPSPYFRRTIPATANATRETTQVVQSVAGTPIVDNNNGVVESKEVPRLDANGNEIPFPLPKGSYTLWVRAIYMADGEPTVYGAWSDATGFSTLAGPVITAPVPDQGIVTAARPTIEWTKIQGAARYEVLVHKFNSRPPYLEANSSSTSYTFTEDLTAGDYTIWVRAVDTRGEFSPWSAPYAITTAGGRPVVTSVGEAEVGDPVAFPTFTWIAVPDAVTYDVFVSHDGVEFNFIDVTGITGTSYQPNDPDDPLALPLPDGDYRVWVRAVFADGTTSPWSVPYSFRGGIASLQSQPSDAEPLLASVEASLTSEPKHAPVTEVRRPDDSTPVDETDEFAEPDFEPPAPTRDEVARLTAPESLPAEILTEIAKHCVETEWWEDGSSRT